MTSCAPLRSTDRFLIPHAFACRVYGCRRPIAWQHAEHVGGVCHPHKLAHYTVPVAIYGHEGDGWLSWPMGARLYAQLRHAGAFDDDGHTRPFAEWGR